MRSPAPRRASWKQAVKLLLWYVMDSVALLVPSSPRPDRILLVRLDNIGDFVLWLRSAQEIAHSLHNSGKFVTLVASSPWANWTQELGLFDQVISLDRSRFAYRPLFRLRFQIALRRLGFSVVVVPGYSHDWAQGDAIARVCGAPERIASEGDPAYGTLLERHVSRSWFTKLLPASRDALMELDRNAEFTAHLLGHLPLTSGSDLTAYYSAEGMHGTAQAAGARAPFYVLVPGASEGMKRWPVEHFREIVRRLHERTGWQGILCGSADEHALAELVSQGQRAPLLNLTGRTTLPQLTALLAGASVLIANDTAAVHIAAAVGTPTVCVLGGGHVGRFLPYPPHSTPFPVVPEVVIFPMACFGCHWSCIFPLGPDEPAPCVCQVTVEAVWERVTSLLEPRPT